MKYYTVLTLFAFLAIAFAQMDDMNRVIRNLSKMFSITQQEVLVCVHQFGVTFADLNNFEEAIMAGANVEPESVKKASCTLVCCAEAEGTMTNGQLNMDRIQKLIRENDAPAEYKPKFMFMVNECERTVRNLTDKCDVGFQFAKCIVDISKQLEE